MVIRMSNHAISRRRVLSSNNGYDQRHAPKTFLFHQLVKGKGMSLHL